VLAEHGGPYVFNQEDFQRRVRWGETAGRRCDLVCPTGKHRRDWNPHAVNVSPVLVTGRPNATVRTTLSTTLNEPLKVVVRGRGIVPDRVWEVPATAGVTARQTEFEFTLPPDIKPGRYVFAVSPLGDGGEFADPFIAVDVE
jgi:hypothetical protein